MENFQISSNVLKVTTIRSSSLWMDSSLADNSLWGKQKSDTTPSSGGFEASDHQGAEPPEGNALQK